MPRAKINKLYRTFVKGLITEASPLTYPADASIDELNTVLTRKGNRTRRMGIRYEQDFVLNPIEFADYDVINEFVWHSVAKQSGKQTLAMQIGYMVHFWDMDVLPLSDNKIAYTIDLRQRKISTAGELDVRTNLAQFAAGAGYLYIAHPYCEPLVVEYDPITKTYKEFTVVVQVRDLEGINDGLANDEEPAILTKEHHYNLLNQGWMAPGTKPVPALAEGETYTSPTVPGSGQPVTAPAPGGSPYFDPYSGEYVNPYDDGFRFRDLQDFR